MIPRDTIEEGGLSGPVRTDQAHDLSLSQGKRDLEIGHYAPEMFFQVVYFQYLHALLALSGG